MNSTPPPSQQSDRSELAHSSTAQEQQTVNENENENEEPLIRTRPLYANNKSAQPTRVHQHWHQQENQPHQQIHQVQHHQQLHLSQYGRQPPAGQNVGGSPLSFIPTSALLYPSYPGYPVANFQTEFTAPLSPASSFHSPTPSTHSLSPPPLGAMSSISSGSNAYRVKRKATTVTHDSSASRKRPSSSSLQSSELKTQQGMSGRAPSFSFKKEHETCIARQMALPENWPILTARGKARKDRRSKRDVFADIARELNKKFTTEESKLKIGESQVKNKVEAMYRIFCKECTFYNSTGNGDKPGGLTLDEQMNYRCHYFFILFEAGSISDDGEIVVHDNESFVPPMMRQASAKVDVQNNVEDVEWSDTEGSTNEDNDGYNDDDGNNGGDDDVGSSDHGRRATSVASTVASIKSTKSTKKSNQETLSAPPKTKGPQQNDITQVVDFMREAENKKMEIENKKMEIENKKMEVERIRIKMEEEREKRRLKMEEERHAIYKRERELELRGRELELQERELKMALEKRKLQSPERDPSINFNLKNVFAFRSRSNSASPTRSGTAHNNSQGF
ncbi:hypothetical protein BX616_004936 [Lobosporangium transversale]|nr:hypothetical protein BX616_004936 [Lobosporangium transversale]